MDGTALRLGKQTEQDVLCRHKGTLLTCRINRPLHDALRTSCIVRSILGGVQDILKPVRTANNTFHAVIIYTEFFHNLRRDRLAHMQNPQQKLARTDVSLSTPLCDVL